MIQIHRKPGPSATLQLYVPVIAVLLFVFAAFAFATDFCVSPAGNDGWSGRKAGPNRAQTDGPFATLERARDAVRALRQDGHSARKGATIWLRGGVYALAKPFELTSADSGTSKSPVEYRAYHNEEVHILGGREVTGWTPVTDPKVLERLDPAARSQVLQTDLKAQGVSDFGKLCRCGQAASRPTLNLELYFHDAPMTLARWPNGAWTTIVATPDGQQGGKFVYDGDRPKRWADRSEIWMHGYWTWDWADSYEHVAAIDTEKHEVATDPPHGAYGYTVGKRYYFLNILEELDAPGEYYLDRTSGILYFWPPAPLEQGKTVVSVLDKPMVSLQDCDYVTLRGLTIECSRGAAVAIRGGSHDAVENCTIRNLGTDGVNVNGGTDHCVRDCELYNLGESGITLAGGDRMTLTPARLAAVNNHIHNYSLWCYTYRPAVLVNGVGNRVAHNCIHDAPHNAILMGGNDHLVEYNEIYNVCRETGDAGAIYLGRNMTMRGTVVRYNYIHDMTRTVEKTQNFVEVMGVYLDDCFCGTTIYGNVFYKAGRAILIGGGRDNTVENNVFVDCHPAVHIDARGTGWAKFWFDGKDPYIMDGITEVHIDQPPYSTRYPQLVNLLNDEPGMAKGNRVTKNICVGGKWIEYFDKLTDATAGVSGNFTEGDPRFVAPDKLDFRLRKDSPARALGFNPIPVKKIGLIKSKHAKAG